MKKIFTAILIGISGFQVATAQVFNSAAIDTSNIESDAKLSIHGFIDTYYNFDFNQPSDLQTPYQVSSARHNELNINLAYADFRIYGENYRASFVPAFGTYMNANYANEPQTLQNLLEANAGFLLHKERKIWLDAGVLNSPITNESPVSKDQLLYSRSIGAEFSPYFVTGARLSVPIDNEWSSSFYVLNGWQQAIALNSDKSYAVQVEYRPSKQLLVDFNLFFGNTQNSKDIKMKDFRNRTFMDCYFIYENINKTLGLSGDVYLGFQQTKNAAGIEHQGRWFNANLQGKIAIDQQQSFALRTEYFSDPDLMVAKVNTGANGFEVFGLTGSYQFKKYKNTAFKFELKNYQAKEAIFMNELNQPSKFCTQLVGNFAVWF
jgi:hypothetical protein